MADGLSALGSLCCIKHFFVSILLIMSAASFSSQILELYIRKQFFKFNLSWFLNRFLLIWESVSQECSFSTVLNNAQTPNKHHSCFENDGQHLYVFIGFLSSTKRECPVRLSLKHAHALQSQSIPIESCIIPVGMLP